MATSIQDDKNKENNKMYNKKEFQKNKKVYQLNAQVRKKEEVD